MEGARNLGPYGAYDARTELDTDAGTELILTISGLDALTVVALEGETGRILWQRPVDGSDRVAAVP